VESRHAHDVLRVGTAPDWILVAGGVWSGSAAAATSEIAFLFPKGNGVAAKEAPFCAGKDGAVPASKE